MHAYTIVDVPVRAQAPVPLIFNTPAATEPPATGRLSLFAPRKRVYETTWPKSSSMGIRTRLDAELRTDNGVEVRVT